MNNSIKNIFSFIKEVMELKNKNIYDVGNYEISLDFKGFYEKYGELINEERDRDINILMDEPVLKLKYIDEKGKKDYPEVPEVLREYIELNSDYDIIEKIDNLTLNLRNDGLLDIYQAYENTIKELNKYNKLVEDYNQLYLNLYKVYKRIKDYEEKIEVILGTGLLVWKDEQGNFIKRHILEASLEIDVDVTNNIITLRVQKDKFRGFVVDFLNHDRYQIKDKVYLYDLVKGFNENLIEDPVELEKTKEDYIKAITYDYSIESNYFRELDSLRSNVTYLFLNSSLIVRNKTVKLWIDDLEKIIDACDKGEFVSPILNMFEVDFEDELQVDRLLRDPSYQDVCNDRVLFPLPANQEQYQIVDKVRSSNIVLVQGPPGTGKSHTITNLLSHYISQGKRVIVTSEKAKALEVLRDKIPEEIRCLSLSLLTSNGVDKDLEFSIETVLKHQTDEAEQVKILEEIDGLTKRLEEVYQKKSDVHHKIVELMSKDTISYRNELNSAIGFSFDHDYTLMDIAMWLDKEKDYRLIPSSDNPNYDYSNLEDFFQGLDEVCDEIKNNHYALSVSVPKIDYLKDNTIELHIKENNQYLEYKIKNDKLFDSIIQSHLKTESIRELSKKIEELEEIYQYFSKEWIIQNHYTVFEGQLRKIMEYIEQNRKLIFNVEAICYDYVLDYDKTRKNELIDAVSELLSIYENDGSISFINRLKLPSMLKNLEGVRLNGREFTKANCSKENLIVVKNLLSYYLLVDKVKFKLAQILKIDLFERLGIEENVFGRYIEQVNGILLKLINFREETKKIDSEFANIIQPKLFPVHYLDDSNEFITSVISDLNYYVVDCFNTKRTKEFISEIREFYQDFSLQNLDRYLISIEQNNLEDYVKSRVELLHEIDIIEKYQALKKIHAMFMLDKHKFIHDYIYEYDLEKRKFVVENIDSILKYHYVLNFYLEKEKANKGLPELFEKREELVLQEKKLVSNLVAVKGWYFQSKGMKPHISASLSKWMSLKKKLGAMTGKNTNLYLRQMREEMQVAKDAIPVWIMPIDKLIEQYPFENDPPFDVLIMDESSQSSIFSISALTRAKKIIIVGDDKQISPTLAFTKTDEINDLRMKYLRDNSWNLQIAKDTSIYEIVQTVCGNKKITLTEHFRCLPEIIHYSNKEFYQMAINPLKVRSRENTIELPIRTVYVPDGRCKKTGGQPYNETEIAKIVDLILEIVHDKQYDGKTIGVIALQNSTRYIQKITELLMKKFGEKLIHERSIKVGNTYDFQGDERDVIILSMIISPVDENGDAYHYRSLTGQEFDKSFNVAASRAKEQMILVHSVRLEELSPNCNRFKLLNYCLNYRSVEQKQVESLFESGFERDVYQVLDAKGIKLTPQVKVGNYRLDFTVGNDLNQKIVVECDGDQWHGIKELESDLERQSVLERCGWKFVRIRASEFYYNREESVEKLVKQICSYLGIDPKELTLKDQIKSDLKYEDRSISKEIFPVRDLDDRVVVQSKSSIFDIPVEEFSRKFDIFEQREDIFSRNIEKENKSFSEKRRTSIFDEVESRNIENKEEKQEEKHIIVEEKKLEKEPFISSEEKDDDDKKSVLYQRINPKSDNIYSSINQFRYMVLYCEGVTVEEIAKFYQCSSEKIVLDVLEQVRKQNDVDTLEESVELFKIKYAGSRRYTSIYELYQQRK